MPSPCLFCEIIAGRLPGQIVYQDDLVTAFCDRFPRAPVHILIVPNRHIDSVSMLCAEDEMVIGRLILTARQLAVKTKIDQTGYRLVINTGPDAGQSVHHLHLHLLGGKSMPLMGG
ncbi:MAG: HIT domain-containing protein [Leptolinea sp.]|jgi:histidine triad (HIT) family protein|nr:HIT domain-containing protein [Leptolinea sp.]